MDERDFDAIIVGSGCAGPIAAYELAKAGKSVLVVERGDYAGSKNMTGGRIYTHSLRKVFSDEELLSAPFERKVVHERLAFMAPDANLTVDFESEKMHEVSSDSYTVLRGPFDQWLAEQAEKAGAEYICGITVEELLKDDSGSVIGIKAGEDELTAQVVILCDGVNSLLAEQAVNYKKPAPTQIAVGITVMKPYAGGRLLSAEASPFGVALSPAQCIHYCLTRPAVASVLCGYKDVEEARQALAYEDAPAEARDYASIIASAPKHAYFGQCTYCGHCQPCVAGIDIATVNKFADLALMQDTVPESIRAHYEALSANASDCIGCHACEPRCPFGVPIAERMEETVQLFSSAS